MENNLLPTVCRMSNSTQDIHTTEPEIPENLFLHSSHYLVTSFSFVSLWTSSNSSVEIISKGEENEQWVILARAAFWGQKVAETF